MDLKDLHDRARPLVGDNTMLGDVRLFGINIQHEHFPSDVTNVSLGDLGVSLTFNVSEANDAEGEPTSLSYLLTVKSQLSEEVSDAEAKNIAAVEATYGALYIVAPGVGVLDRATVEAFGYAVATIAIWPFLRSTIAGVCREMNYYSIILPTLTQQDILASANAATEDS